MNLTGHFMLLLITCLSSLNQAGTFFSEMYWDLVDDRAVPSVQSQDSNVF